MVILALYLSTVVIANFVVERFGVVPVGFGLMAPAAVYIVGISFTLRDIVHEKMGRGAVVVAIIVGAALSAIFSPALAVASGVAFLFSELADLLVYHPLRERNLVGAVVASNVVGLTIDSVLFLWLAFGSLAFLPGQIVGKSYMTLAAIPLIVLARNWIRSRSEAEPAVA